jgi:hypothetical protein
VSIGSLQSNPWAASFASQSGIGASRRSVPRPPPGASGPAQGGSSARWFSSPQGGSGTPAAGIAGTGSGNQFRSLASDIQAMLIQAQSTTTAQAAAITGSGTSTGAASTGATSSGSGANAAGGSVAVNPEQKLVADLQSLLSNPRSGQSGGSAGTQTASINPAAANAPAPRHHHHHHEAGNGGGSDIASAGNSTGANTAGATASSATPAATASQPAATGSNSVQAVSQAFAADIMQAIKAYGGGGSAATMPAMTI